METMRLQRPSSGVLQQITSIGGQVVRLYSVSTVSVSGPSKGSLRPLAKKSNANEGLNSHPSSLVVFRPTGAAVAWAFADRHPSYDDLSTNETMSDRHGRHVGDPKKGAKLMYEFAMNQPPLRVIVGTDAYQRIMDRVEEYEQNYKHWEKLSNRTKVKGQKPPP